MDALTHAVEAYIGNSTTPGTRKNARDAVQLIFENLDTAYTDGSNKEARRNMLRASYFAGCAFTKSYVAMYMQLPILWEDNTMFHMDLPTLYFSLMFWKLTEKRFIRSWQPCCCRRCCLQETPEEEAALNFIQAVKDMKARFGIGDTIPESKKKTFRSYPIMRTKRRIRCIRYRY